MKKIIISFVLLSFCFVLSSCKERTLDDIMKDGKIIVATNAEFPPFEYLDVYHHGFWYWFVKLYAKYLGVDIEINNIDFDGALLSVSSNKADLVIAGVTKNEKREQSLSFSNGYFSASQVVIVKKNSNISGTTIEEIRESLSQNNATIGAQAGTVGEYYAKGDSDWVLKSFLILFARLMIMGLLQLRL